MGAMDIKTRANFLERNKIFIRRQLALHFLLARLQERKLTLSKPLSSWLIECTASIRLGLLACCNHTKECFGGAITYYYCKYKELRMNCTRLLPNHQNLIYVNMHHSHVSLYHLHEYSYLKLSSMFWKMGFNQYLRHEQWAYNAYETHKNAIMSMA